MPLGFFDMQGTRQVSGLERAGARVLLDNNGCVLLWLVWYLFDQPGSVLIEPCLLVCKRMLTIEIRPYTNSVYAAGLICSPTPLLEYLSSSQPLMHISFGGRVVISSLCCRKGTEVQRK